MNKFKHLEAIRGLASVLVVVAHFACAFFPYSLFGPTSYGKFAPHSTIEPLFFKTPLAFFTAGQLALSLFFIMSGYVLSHKLVGRSESHIRVLGAALKRPVRLIGLIWFSMILAYALWHLGVYFNREAAPLTTSVPWFSSYWGRAPVFPRLLRDLFLSPFAEGEFYNGPLWMMDIELDGSMLTFAYLFLVGDRRFRLFILIPGIIALWIWSGWHVGFAIGILFAELELILNRKNFRFPAYVPAIFLALGIFIGSYPPFLTFAVREQTVYGFLPFLEFVYPMVGGALVFAAVLFNGPVRAALDKDWLSKLGHISYSMFAIHFLVLGTFSAFIYVRMYPTLGPNGAGLVSLLLTLIVVILLAKVVTRFVDDHFSWLADTVSATSQRILAGWLERWRARTRPTQA